MNEINIPDDLAPIERVRLALTVEVAKVVAQLGVLKILSTALEGVSDLSVTKTHQVAPTPSPAPPDPVPQVKPARKPRKVKETAPARRGRPSSIRDRIRAVLQSGSLPKEFSVDEMRAALPKVSSTNLCAALIGMAASGELSSTGTGRARRYQVVQLRSALSGLPPASERERTYAKFRETIKTHNLPEEA